MNQVIARCETSEDPGGEGAGRILKHISSDDIHFSWLNDDLGEELRDRWEWRGDTDHEEMKEKRDDERRCRKEYGEEGAVGERKTGNMRKHGSVEDEKAGEESDSRARGATRKVMRAETTTINQEGTGAKKGKKAWVEDGQEEMHESRGIRTPEAEPRMWGRSKISMSATKAMDEIAKHLTTNKAQLFPTTRRPAPRALSDERQEVMDEWVEKSGINVYTGLSENERKKANRLLYTWRDVFESNLLHIRTTDLIEHGIDLTKDATPSKSKIPLYTEAELRFVNKLIPAMEEKGLILRCDSTWVARTKFPPKPNRPGRQEDNLRMVHNYIPLNRYTLKSQYPCANIEQIVHTVLKNDKKCFFYTDATDSYWAIPLRKSDYTLTAFSTPKGQYCYTVMGQGLKGAAHTYARFRDLVFGPIPEDNSNPGNVRPAFPSLIGDRGTTAFDGMVDDSYGSARDFQSMFDFLHYEFFPRCVFGPIYLKPAKSFFFFPSLEFVGLEGTGQGLRPSIRKRNQILEWPTPRNLEEVNAFCFLTPYLRRFIPGRAELVAILKRSREKGTPEEGFYWDQEKENAFNAIKAAIAFNAMAPVDVTLQYHLAMDASQRGLGGALFQLHGIPPHTEANNSAEHQEAERIIQFLSFRLNDAETRYTNPEREALAVVRGLSEIRWMVVAYPYPIYVYTDHQALKTLLTGPKNDSHGRIANWQQRISEYDMILLHRAATTHFMGIADGMSRLPTALMGRTAIEDAIGTDAGWIWNEQGGRRVVEIVRGATAIREMMSEDWQGERRADEVNDERDQKEGDMAWEWSERAREMRRLKWERFLSSDMYRKIVLFKLEGVRGLTVPAEDVGRNEMRVIVRQARKYVLGEGTDSEEKGRLFYVEKDGRMAACITEEEVDKVLAEVHDAHGHFAHGITAGRLHGNFYWPTRNADVARWTASCRSCQRVAPIRKSGEIRPIIQLQPMDMWGMDYIGPINPPCAATGAKYILIVVDYFSRFLFGKAVVSATMQSTMDVILNHIVPVCGWPRSIYSDNGTHFTGGEIQTMFRNFGVTHFHAAISHPSSVGLAERYVQMTVGRLRLKCIDCKDASHWGLLVRDAILDINTRCIRIHGYTPAEILLGYNPATSRVRQCETAEDWLKEGLNPEDVLHPGLDEMNWHITSREENGDRATQRLAREQHRLESRAHPPSGTYRKPKAGDLVLLRDLARDQQHGRKLDPRWSEPRIVDRISKNGVSAYIRALHDPPSRAKRYHIDDLRIYVPRAARPTTSLPAEDGGGEPSVQTATIAYSRKSMGDFPGTFRTGQRAFDLSDLLTKSPKGGRMGARG